MKNYFDKFFTCNDSEFCSSCNQTEICSEFKKCFNQNPYIMWGEMKSFEMYREMEGVQ